MTPLPHVHPAMHIGDDSDAHRLLLVQRQIGLLTRQGWQASVAPGWAVVHAAKSPWHREMVGYADKSAPAGPEQYVARRDRRLALNLVDMPEQSPALVVPILDAAASFVQEQVDAGMSVLVHCNMGLSRSPATVLWWMHHADPEQPHDEALAELLADHPYARTDSGIMRMVGEQWRG